jgi:diguanylate cyclase (GGDEF)-like protein
LPTVPALNSATDELIMDYSSLATSQLLAILDVTRRLAELRLVQPLMEYVAVTVFEITPAERCLIVLFAEDGTPQVQITKKRREEIPGITADQISRSILERVCTSMTPLCLGDALEDAGLKDAPSVRSLRLRSIMCVPLVSYGQSIGAIYVENRSARNQFRQADLMPLILFSHQVAGAIESARIYEALEERITERTRTLQEANLQLAEQAVALREQSIRDSLTGLYNRRYYSESLSKLFALAGRYQRPLTLACLDIDNFKQINDTYFHTSGDRVLVAVATILGKDIRQTDALARIGGEEFAIIMPETILTEALVLCERLRSAIEHYDWSMIAPNLQVTISIGVAGDGDSADEQELMRRADAQLYAAKRLGKNRVVSGAPQT